MGDSGEADPPTSTSAPGPAGTPMKMLPLDAWDRPADLPQVKPRPKLPTWNYSVVAYTPDSNFRQGVGTVLRVQFDSDIPEKARWKVQDSLAIDSTDPTQDLSGGWVWLDGSTLAYRPRDYWNPRQVLTIASSWPVDEPMLRIDRKGRDHGPKGTPLSWKHLVEVQMTNSVQFQVKIGSEQIVKIDGATHQSVVSKAGKVIFRAPVSLGKPGWETGSGIKTVMERYEVKRLYNPGQWDVTVPYAMRLTLSGEFLHSAPWNGQIGYANLSHGCTNVTVDDARWYYENLQQGDPVVTTNAGSKPELWDNPGAGWNLSWRQWQDMRVFAP